MSLTNDLEMSIEVFKGRAVMEYITKDTAWYTTDSGFSFPVPLNEIGNGVLHTIEKAITLMKWIKKHHRMIEGAKAEQV